MKQLTLDILESFENIIENDEMFDSVRAIVKYAVDNSPNSVDFTTALEQSNAFKLKPMDSFGYC